MAYLENSPHPLRARLATLAPGALLASLLAALLIAAGAGSTSVAATATLWLYLFWLYALGMGACGLLVHAMMSARASSPLYALSALLATLWAAANYLLVWTASKTFANRELSALLVTLLALIAGGAALKLRARLSGRVPSAPLNAALLSGAVSIWAVLFWHNREGFTQLDPWTVAMPAVMCALALGARLVIEPRLSRRASEVLSGLAGALLLASLAGFGAVELSDHPASEAASRFGPITRYISATVQRVTDFDGDGHSSLMGGADCAPFDAMISPGAREIPGDGLDNNCIGGDAATLSQKRSPAPHPLPEGWPSMMNVLVISIEALRPDHIHALGYHRETSPHLDALIAESVLFERFYASSTFTRLSLPSLWTTAPPSRIAWEAQESTKMPRISASNPWVPERFEQAGFTTLAVQTNFPAFNAKDRIGFDRGFTRYNAGFKLAYRGGTMKGFPSIAQTDRVVELLEEFKQKPFMLWVHMVEPHYAYEQFPGAPDFGDDPEDRYDSEIWGVDQQIGRIVRALKAHGTWDRTVVFITGDHGEEFGEHDQRYHGSNLYEPQIRTLGVLRVPGLKPRRLKEPVGFTDLGATLLNLAGVTERYEGLKGRNLTSALLKESPLEHEDMVISEVWDVTSKRGYQLAVIAWPYKLILSGKGAAKRELYDLVKDPLERENLWGDAALAAIQKRLLAQALSYLDSSDRTYRDQDNP